jgi:hypothetical protein
MAASDLSYPIDMGTATDTTPVYAGPDINSATGGYSPPSDVSILSNADTTSSGGGFGGALDSLFSALPSLASSIGNIVAGPPKPGQLVYNPATGTWQPAGAMTTRQTAAVQGTVANPLVLVAIAVVVILLIRK